MKLSHEKSPVSGGLFDKELDAFARERREAVVGTRADVDAELRPGDLRAEHIEAAEIDRLFVGGEAFVGTKLTALVFKSGKHDLGIVTA